MASTARKMIALFFVAGATLTTSGSTFAASFNFQHVKTSSTCVTREHNLGGGYSYDTVNLRDTGGNAVPFVVLASYNGSRCSADEAMTGMRLKVGNNNAISPPRLIFYVVITCCKLKQ